MSDELIIGRLWQEHLASLFPGNLCGKDVSGIDTVVLDADIAGCISVFLDRGTLDVWRTATLGLCYRDCDYLLSRVNEDEAEYFRRLALLAELVLKVLRKLGQLQ